MNIHSPVRRLSEGDAVGQENILQSVDLILISSSVLVHGMGEKRLLRCPTWPFETLPVLPWMAGWEAEIKLDSVIPVLHHAD